MRDRYEEARKDDNVSTTKALGSLFERKADDAASKAESKKSRSDAQFKIVNKRDSVIVPQGHESGWLNKVADRDALAQQGDGWKSPAFNIVPTASGVKSANGASGNGNGGAPKPGYAAAPAPRV